MKMCFSPCSKDIVIVEPVYCPEAVTNLYLYEPGKKNKGDVPVSDMRKKAKKHLSAMNWVIWYGEKAGRRELRYTSPSPKGKTYYSLRLACKACIDEVGGVPESIAFSPKLKRSSSDSSDVKDPDIGVNRGIASSPKFEPSFVDSSDVSQSRKKRKHPEIEIVSSPKLGPSFADSSISQSRKKRKHPEIVSSPIKLEGSFAKSSDASQSRKRRKHPQTGVPESIACGAENKNADIAKPRIGKDMATLKQLRDKQKPTKPVCVQQSSRRAPLSVRPRSSSSRKSLLSQLIGRNVVLPMTKAYYCGRNDRGPLAEGWITRDGIKCNCCNKLFTLTAFEAHSGSKKHWPTANIFLEDGRSLLDCRSEMVSSNKMASTAKSTHDSLKYSFDMCSVCYDGGELVLCDQCPTAFHKNCLGLEDVPDGDWFCPSCRCRICGEKTTDIVQTCEQCEHTFHMGCLERSQEIMKSKSSSESENKWFCSDKCEYIFSSLHQLIGRPLSLGADNLTWRVLKYTDSDHQDPKLNEAIDVMHECFESFKEPITGRDLVEDVVFNRISEGKQLSFKGFYTVILESEHEVISVATVRVFKEVAEIPLVATRFMYRGQGMCRLLMGELEKQLSALGVKRLILPAARDVLTTWTTKFGFSKMTDSERLNYLDYTFLDFQDTIMCHKLLSEITSPESGGYRMNQVSPTKFIQTQLVMGY